MAFKFAHVLAALGLGSTTEAVTEAHLEAADTKIAGLELAKTEAETKLATVEASLKTAQEEKTKIAGELQTVTEKAATLQSWKDTQAQVDGREKDESNSLDNQPEALEPWERASASAIASAKKRLGEK